MARIKNNRITKKVNLDRTLTSLEKNDWGPPSYSSHLVTECHALRHKPLKHFGIEDLRIMIGQNISLEYMLPLALIELEINPLVSGNFYSGDLLVAVLTAEKTYYTENPAVYDKVKALIVKQKKKILTDSFIEDIYIYIYIEAENEFNEL